MKVIVTGGSGFIGCAMVRLLIAEGHEVLNIDKLTYAGDVWALRELKGHSRYRMLQADICDLHAMQTAFADYQPDAVINLAAESHVDRSIDAPDAFVQTNIFGTYTLLKCAREHATKLPANQNAGFRFLHISTDEVFGSLNGSGRFTERTAYDPHSPYAATKAASDLLTRAWGHTYALPVIVTNCSNNYGPYQFPEKFVPTIIIKALRGDAIPVYGSGQNIRDWLYVEDHAEALLTVLQRGRTGQTYNIGADNQWRNIDLARLICAILDELRPRSDGSYTEQIRFVPDRPGHDLHYAIDASKIRDELGWIPKETPKSGFRKTVQWYLENEQWWHNILNGKFNLERLGTAPSVQI